MPLGNQMQDPHQRQSNLFDASGQISSYRIDSWLVDSSNSTLSATFLIAQFKKLILALLIRPTSLLSRESEVILSNRIKLTHFPNDVALDSFSIYNFKASIYRKPQLDVCPANWMNALWRTSCCCNRIAIAIVNTWTIHTSQPLVYWANNLQIIRFSSI